MALRTALQQSRIVTFGVLAAVVWVLLAVFQVYGRLGPLSADGVGQTPAAGVVGLVVLGSLLVMLVVLYSELTEETPAPEPWPPE